MHIITSTIEFAKEYPQAFNALPEPYQADDCLEYQINGKHIYCYPKLDQEPILGDWLCIYDSFENRWL